MSKIAVSIISKGTDNDPVNLRRCLNSIVPYTDGIFITFSAPKEELKEAERVCREFNVHISYNQPFWNVTKEAVEWLTDYLGYEPYMKVGDKLFLFDEARNFNFAQIPQKYDWIFWIDSDDVLLDGKNLWKLKEIGEKAPVDAFFLKYIYRATLDEKGNVKEILIEHLKERMVRNGLYKWVAPVHESLVEATRPTTRTHIDDCKVLHTVGSDHIKKSIERNLPLLELALYKSEGKDPRHIYYLAKAYVDMQTSECNDKAIPLIEAFLWGNYPSEWPEERAQAFEYLAELYRQKGYFNKAIKACLNAMIEEPQRKFSYLNLASVYLDKKEWDKALFWVHFADRIEERATTLNVNPRDKKIVSLSIIYTASLNKGKTYDAYEAIVKLLDILPENEAITTCYDFILKQKNQRDIGTVIAGLIKHLKSTGEKDKILSLLASIPEVAENDPVIMEIKKEFLK